MLKNINKQSNKGVNMDKQKKDNKKPTNNFEIEPSGRGSLASRVSVPTVVAYQSCPS